MATMTLTEIAALLAGATLLSLAVIWLVGLLPNRARPRAERPAAPECHFLFRGATLIDHDAGALWPDDSDGPNDDWSRFRDWLAFRFGTLPTDPLSITTGKRDQSSSAASLSSGQRAPASWSMRVAPRNRK